MATASSTAPTPRTTSTATSTAPPTSRRAGSSCSSPLRKGPRWRYDSGVRERPRFFMRRLIAIPVLLAAACSGGNDDDATPTPAPHHLLVTGPLIITEEIPATYTVQVVSTSGAATTWSGVVDVASITGPASPAQMTITN